MGHALLAIGDGTSHQGSIRIEDGRIAGLDDGPHRLDFELPFGSTVTPGLIDLHVNGSSTHWLNTEPLQSLKALATMEPMHGVTAYLPTVMSASWDQMLRAAAEIWRVVDQPATG